ncbi:MAG: PEGA domain-containing protein, partial [Methanolinea sp.]|nr:PEGA domain-containing protein [Methanolinea sp.]
KFSGITPLTIPDLSPGPYAMRVELSGYLTKNETVEVIAGESSGHSYILTPVVPVTLQETITRDTRPPPEKPAETATTSTGFPLAGSVLGISAALMLFLLQKPRRPSPPGEGSHEDTGRTG